MGASLKAMQTFNNYRGQVAIEFMSIVGVVFFIFMIILIIFLEKSTEVNRQKELLLVDDMAKSIQKEALLAEQVGEGYQRSFVIPSSIDQYNFSIITTPGEITVKTDHYDIQKRIPNIIGNFSRGSNTITKTQGTIRVTQP